MTPLSLGGIIHNGANAFAYVSTRSTDGGWYRVGENIMGWTIAEIGRVDLTVTSGDERVRIKLRPDDDPSVAPQPPPAPSSSANPGSETNLKQRNRS